MHFLQRNLLMKRMIALLAVFAASWIGFGQEQDIFPLVQSGQVEKIHGQLERKKADLTALRTADNPGDRFFIRGDK
jgi:hypothetical protein